MYSANLIESLIKCQNATSISRSLSLSLSSLHTLTLNPLIFSISLMHFVFYCFSCPMSNFLPLLSLSQNTQTFAGLHGEKKLPFFATPSLAVALVHPHMLASLSSLFYLQGQRHSRRERGKKLSYRSELHTVSILPSLNDLNKEFTTAGSE